MFSFVQSEAEYLSARKLSLVNGMHTVLAFMTLGQNYVFPENVPDEDRSKQEVRSTVTFTPVPVPLYGIHMYYGVALWCRMGMGMG